MRHFEHFSNTVQLPLSKMKLEEKSWEMVKSLESSKSLESRELYRRWKLPLAKKNKKLMKSLGKLRQDGNLHKA